jgi:hypothetical protein
MHQDTIATYEDGGRTYEIDHLGISSPGQWGTFMPGPADAVRHEAAPHLARRGGPARVRVP